MKFFKSPIFLISVFVIVIIVVGSKLKQKTAEEQEGNILKEVKVEFPYRTYDLYSVAFIEPASFIAVGSNGIILRSDDSAKTWSEQRLDCMGDNLLSVFFIDNTKGWIVGTGALAFKTTDGGRTWEKAFLQTSATCSINLRCNDICLKNIYFFDDQVGWIAGEGPLLLCTNDGGKKWDERNIGKDFVNLNDVAFFSKDAGLVVGESGTLCSTKDGGKTWTGHDDITTKSLMRIHIIDDKKALIVGLEGIVLYTDDEGETWQKIKISNEDRDLDNHIFTCDWLGTSGVGSGSMDVMQIMGDGVLARSFDLGRSWRFSNVIDNDVVKMTYRLISDTYFIDHCNGVVVGKNGLIAVTHDAQRWTRVN